jgi:hypothetical protein
MAQDFSLEKRCNVKEKFRFVTVINDKGILALDSGTHINMTFVKSLWKTRYHSGVYANATEIVFADGTKAMVRESPEEILNLGDDG